MLLTDDQRAALEGFNTRLLDEREMATVGALWAEMGVTHMNEQHVAWLLAADARLRATPCPHVTGRTTQWCALGQTTAEADRALAKLGAAYALEIADGATVLFELETAVTDDETIMTRARELAQEGTNA